MSPAPDGRRIGYQYDANLSALTPPGRSAHVFAYDGLDQRTEYDPPEIDSGRTVTRYRYNLDRQLTEIERPDGATIDLGYDFGGRLATRTTDADTLHYTYDAATGQLQRIDAPGDIGLAFEHDGLLPTASEWTGPVSGRVDRTWDNNFWLTEETVGGHSTTFGYDDDGLLTAAGDLNLARDAANGLITGTSQADITGSRAYNAFGELTQRSVRREGNDLYSATYERDALGRITTKTETLDGNSVEKEYVYDAAGRLTEVRHNGTPAHLYAYDANGNRTSHTGPQGTRTGQYDAQDRLTQYGDYTYSYTEAGDLQEKTGPEGTTTYDYDATGNLRQVALPDGTDIDYLIDGQDRRIGKRIDGELQKGWLYRDQLNPVAQTDANGNITHRFVYAEKTHAPSYMIKTDPDTGTEAEYRIITDHLGSVRLVINTQTNQIEQRIDYDPFGHITTDTNPGLQPFGFAGGLHDQDTGLVRFGARDYDPHAGRWTAKDP